MNENFRWIAAAVVFVGLAVGAVIYRIRQPTPVPAAAPTTATPAKAAIPAEPAIRHPLPATEAKEPLPPLDQSDSPVLNALAELMGNESVDRFVIPKELVPHIVVTIDNLPTEKVAERLRPLKSTPGQFEITGTEEAPVLDPSNFERYKPMVELIRSTDTQDLMAIYTRYYPLFQEAYESLGHPPQYFNDRVVEVIDHLLETPDLKGPIALARPGVQYEYADPSLESRSAGQKLLMRMGSDNARIIKDKLRELRSAIAARQPGKPG
jgi:hypothetical protein